MSRLSHTRADGTVRMVDVGGKPSTSRRAVAEGIVKLLPKHQAALMSLQKGDALVAAQIAGIQGGKRCSELIPLCHPVALTDLDVRITQEDEGLHILSEAAASGPTGVEMEAYTAVVVAGITLIDMLKGVDPDLTLTDVRLLEKTGGKAPWKRS